MVSSNLICAGFIDTILKIFGKQLFCESTWLQLYASHALIKICTAYKTWLNKRVYHLLNKTVFLNLSLDPFKQIFSKILRSFGLPVGPNKYHIAYADPSYEFSSTCLWVVAMISPTGTAMSHIRQFIQTIEPFLHPSNMGWWQRSLNGAISQLCSMFTARVHLERLVQCSLRLSNVYLQWQC